MTRTSYLPLAALATSWTIAAHAQPSKIVEYSFLAGTDGNSPRGTLLAAQDGTFYGTTAVGGPNGNGTVFHLMPQNGAVKASEQTLWTFTGGQDGSLPMAGLIADAKGALYGTTATDGAGGRGTVFRLNPPVQGSTVWTETTLYSFSGHADGGQPVGSLIADNSGSGVLYGTARFGGAQGLGVIFSLTPPVAGSNIWTETVLWSFTGQSTGSAPVAALLQDASGALYGTASTGGAMNAGTVYQLSPPPVSGNPWAFKVIYNFRAGSDGANPQGTLIADASGVFYGTAAYGGLQGCQMASWPYYGEDPSVTAPTLAAPYVIPGGNNCGVVFQLTPTAVNGPWTQSLVYSFSGSDEDGNTPVAEMLLQPGSVLYGTVPLTSQTGLKGLLYKLTPAQPGQPYMQTNLQTFTYEIQGTYPRAGVVPGSDGRLYGTNAFGGSTWVHVKVYGYGAVYAALP